MYWITHPGIVNYIGIKQVTTIKCIFVKYHESQNLSSSSSFGLPS